MSVDTLSEQDVLMVHALHAAKQQLVAIRPKPMVEEREVRGILREIACDALQPLPTAIEVYIPGETLMYVRPEKITEIINAIDLIGRSMLDQ